MKSFWRSSVILKVGLSLRLLKWKSVSFACIVFVQKENEIKEAECVE